MVQFGMEDDSGDLVPFPDQQPDHGDSFTSNDGDASSLSQQPDQDDGFMSAAAAADYSSVDEQSDDEDDSSFFMSDYGDYSSSLDEQEQSDGEDSSISMSDSDDDDYSSLDEQSDEDDDIISADADDDDDDGFVEEQPDEGALFMANLMGAIRSFTSDGFQAPGGGAGDPAATYSEQYYVVYLAVEDNDDEEEEYAAAFPVHAASEAAIAALETAEAPADDCCPVCLQDGAAGAAGGDAWRRVAPCGHRFHAACVGQWLRVKLSCPVCRCPAAVAAAEPQLPLPEIVEEMLAMSSSPT